MPELCHGAPITVEWSWSCTPTTASQEVVRTCRCWNRAQWTWPTTQPVRIRGLHINLKTYISHSQTSQMHHKLLQNKVLFNGFRLNWMIQQRKAVKTTICHQGLKLNLPTIYQASNLFDLFDCSPKNKSYTHVNKSWFFLLWFVFL